MILVMVNKKIYTSSIVFRIYVSSMFSVSSSIRPQFAFHLWCFSRRPFSTGNGPLHLLERSSFAKQARAISPPNNGDLAGMMAAAILSWLRHFRTIDSWAEIVLSPVLVRPYVGSLLLFLSLYNSSTHRHGKTLGAIDKAIFLLFYDFCLPCGRSDIPRNNTSKGFPSPNVGNNDSMLGIGWSGKMSLVARQAAEDNIASAKWSFGMIYCQEDGRLDGVGARKSQEKEGKINIRQKRRREEQICDPMRKVRIW